MSIFQIIAVILIFCALCLFGGVAAFQKYSVYKFSPETQLPSDYDLTTVREVFLKSEQSTPLRVWASDPAPGRPVILGFYGNFSKLGTSFKHLQPLMDLGYGLAVMEYRGSETGSKPAGETAFADDARLLYDRLDEVMGKMIEPNQRVIHGFSLGASIATHLAASRDAAALVLESGFDRLCRFQQRRMKGLPACKLMWAERHDVIDLIPSVNMPVLIAHGDLDEAIPLPWSQALFDAANSPKEFLLIENGAHGDLLDKGLATGIVEFVTPYIR